MVSIPSEYGIKKLRYQEVSANSYLIFRIFPPSFEKLLSGIALFLWIYNPELVLFAYLVLWLGGWLDKSFVEKLVEL